MARRIERIHSGRHEATWVHLNIMKHSGDRSHDTSFILIGLKRCRRSQISEFECAVCDWSKANAVQICRCTEWERSESVRNIHTILLFFCAQKEERRKRPKQLRSNQKYEKTTIHHVLDNQTAEISHARQRLQCTRNEISELKNKTIPIKIAGGGRKKITKIIIYITYYLLPHATHNQMVRIDTLSLYIVPDVRTTWFEWITPERRYRCKVIRVDATCFVSSLNVWSNRRLWRQKTTIQGNRVRPNFLSIGWAVEMEQPRINTPSSSINSE